MKYSKRFNEDYELYCRLTDVFDFAPYDPTKGKQPTNARPNTSVKEAFFQFDTHGKLLAIAAFDELLQLLRAKASLNFHIKIYAKDRARGWLGLIDLLEIQQQHNLPDWFIDAVEKQKVKYYEPMKVKHIAPNRV